MDNKQKKDDLLLSFKYILDFYYGDVPPKTIDTVLPHEKKHTTVEDLKYGASDFGLVFEEGDFSADTATAHILPCILTNEENGAVILSGLDGDMCEILSPDTHTKERKTIQELSATYPKILLFYKPDRQHGILQTEERGKEWFWRHLQNSKPEIIKIAVFTFFINIFVILIPLYTMNVYNRVIPNFATDTLFVLSFGVVLIFIFDALFKSVRTYLLESMGKKIGGELEEELLKKILILDSSHNRLLAGSKANLFKEMGQVKDFFMSKSISHALDLPFVVLTLAVIFVISPTIAAVTLICSGVILGVNIVFQKPIFSLGKKLFADGQHKHNYLFETIKGADTLKLSNAVSWRVFRWRQMVGFYNFVNLKIQLYSGFASNISYAVMQFATVVTLIVGVYLIQDKSMTLGALIALGILVGRAIAPIVSISGFLSKYKELNESLTSLDKFWHLPSEIKPNIELGLKKISGNIEFENVSLTYQGAKHPSLSNISFNIKAGEKVGFIGPTGAGKSSILRLISAINTPDSGSIFIDGHDIVTIHPVELRESIGVMPQEPFMFAGTIKENIEIGRKIGKDALVGLLQQIGLAELIKRSGEGENFQVGENGSRLSVGQKQLVGLARAVIQNPSVLILDEPTTGMDMGLERQMISHLKTVTADKTVIVITHRYAALELVDRVMVVNNGRIVADGPRDIILSKLQNPNGAGS